MATTPPTPQALPQSRLLSNGRLTVMFDGAGSGYSHWRDIALTRWREDRVVNGWGNYVLLRDETNGEVWSATPQPLGSGDKYTFTLDAGVASVGGVHGTLTSTLEVAVAADRDVELRRVTLTNRGDQVRDISLTSYAELVLGPAGADAAHPAFSKMFVQTQWVENEGILLATRRRRAPEESEVWAAQLAVVDAQPEVTHEFESDRLRFLGRGHSLRRAQAMRAGVALSNTSGCVLDPIISLRRRVRIAPGASVCLAFWTALADSRANALALVHALDARADCESVLAGARAHAKAEQTRFGIDAEHSERYATLASALLVTDPALRAPVDVLARGNGGAPVLWSCGISGDRPIVLVSVAAESDLACVRELLLAQRYWQAQRLGADVVFLHSGDPALQTALDELKQTQNAQLTADHAAVAAAVFVLRGQDISAALRDGLATAARIVFDAGDGLPNRRTRNLRAESLVSVTATARLVPVAQAPTPAATSDSLPREFDNGIGGFIDCGRTYAITLTDERCTPLPWVNVIANPDFGFLVSAEGGGYTWSINSQQNALTPWPNDPVSDAPHEILYLRDTDSGEVWSATALPIRVPAATYRIEHGKGWSRFRNDAHGIDVDLLQFVPVDDAVKLSRLRVCNRTTRTRRLSITGYVEWMLGANGTVPAPFVVTSRDDSGALFARNAWRAEFGHRVAFIDMGGHQTACSGDRGEFLGRGGRVENPAALAGKIALSGCVGAGLDPCGALQAGVELAPNASVEFVFALGDAESAETAQALIAKYRHADLDAVLDAVHAQWHGLLDTVQVHTPDRALDLMLNDWLLYQVLSCRLWARTAYYQASGAYGFRDQLQDVMALCIARPDVARAQVLRAAGRQFTQGDVQHWWLPPNGQGIRTRISDDRVWLPYVATHYVATTGDTAVLDASVPLLEGETIKDGNTDAYFQPTTGTQGVSLYEHCARAIDSSLTRGAHGLPLMGTGDWNDGMNNVGAKGRGESTWLAWFLLATINAFAPIAQARGDAARSTSWRDYATALRGVLDGEDGWDGAWYRRGYYDDGAPLGSHTSDECWIDTIAQSWSVMAATTHTDHAKQAMASVERLLIDQENRIHRLFTPPFENSRENPGYIKGYPQGIRENGGQYTHGATWSIFAFALLGDGERAGDVFDMLNPIHHSDSAAAIARYRVEPYVACADVYSVAPYVGRGGWTWYTGSAGWLYRAGLEAILGFQLRGDRLRLDPCIPKTWPRYDILYRHRTKADAITRYDIAVENPSGVQRGVVSAELDGAPLTGIRNGVVDIPLIDDGQVHRVRVVLG